MVKYVLPGLVEPGMTHRRGFKWSLDHCRCADFRTILYWLPENNVASSGVLIVKDSRSAGCGYWRKARQVSLLRRRPWMRVNRDIMAVRVRFTDGQEKLFRDADSATERPGGLLVVAKYDSKRRALEITRRLPDRACGVCGSCRRRPSDVDHQRAQVHASCLIFGPSFRAGKTSGRDTTDWVRRTSRRPLFRDDGVTTGRRRAASKWLGGRDSNPDNVVQSHVSYR